MPEAEIRALITKLRARISAGQQPMMRVRQKFPDPEGRSGQRLYVIDVFDDGVGLSPMSGDRHGELWRWNELELMILQPEAAR